MKIAIIGSRGFTDNNLFDSTMQEYLSLVTEIISGGAIGAESMASAWAKEHGILLTEFLPDYAKYGRAAPINKK